MLTPRPNLELAIVGGRVAGGEWIPQGSSYSGVGKVGRSSGSGHYVKWPEAVLPYRSHSVFRPSSPCGDEFQTGEKHAPFYSRVAREGLCPGVIQAGSTGNSFVLFPDVHGSEKGGEKATGSRFVGVEQVAAHPEVQNGDPGSDSGKHCGGPLGRVPGHPGRLFERSIGPRVSQVFRVRSRGTDLCVPGSSVRTIDCSMGLYESNKTHKGPSASTRGVSSIVLRRFSDTSRLPAANSGSYPDDPRVVGVTRLQNKSEQVVLHSSAISGISGSCFEPGRSNPFSASEQSRQDLALGRGGGRKGVLLKEGPRESSRVPELHRKLPSPRKVISHSNNGLDELPHGSGVQGPSSPHRRGAKVCSNPLDRSGSLKESRSHAHRGPISGHHDRRVSLRMGRGHDTFPGAGNVGTISGGVLDELERTKGHLSDSVLLCRSAAGEDSQSAVGQHDRHSVSPSAGVPSLSFSLEPHQGDSGNVPGEEHHFSSCSSKRSPQYPGRRPVQEHPVVNRVEPGSADVCMDMPTSGLASSRSIRDEVQQPASAVCVSLPGPASGRLGCLQPGVGGVPISLRFPSNPGPSGGSLQAEQLSGLGVPDSSLLANSRMVSTAGSSLPEGLPPEAGSFPAPEDPRGSSGIPSGSLLKPSRLDTIALGLSRQGFDELSVRLMLKQHKGSTRGQYQSAWSKFLAFLTREGISHDKILLSTVFNFLSSEFDKWDRAYSTIAGYKCALFHPLLYALDLNLESRQSDSFMHGLFQVRPPPRTSRFPLWSLSDVLHFLLSGPCEPLEEAPRQLLTMKVLFLILLASGRRISEVANISRSYVIRGDSILLRWLPDFRAKAARADFCPEDPSITRMDSRDEDELKLCPVRAWEIYRRRSEEFLSSEDGDCFWPVSQDTLSDYVQSLVRRARRFAGRTDNSTICVHQTKKLGFSLSKKFFKCADDVLCKKMGNKTIRVLNRVYMGDVCPPRFSCVVPAGTLKSSS